MASEKADDLLRNIVESNVKSCCTREEKLPWKRRVMIKLRYSSPRRWFGRKILEFPNKRNGGILIQVDLARKTKEEVEEFHTAIKHLRRAGIMFDTGYGGMYDMEFDWSLKGAYAKCKRCGYDSETDRILLDIKEARKHFVQPCDGCRKDLDSDQGFFHIKRHFWSKTLRYHTECWDQDKEEPTNV